MKQNFGRFCFPSSFHPFCRSFTKCSSQNLQSGKSRAWLQHQETAFKSRCFTFFLTPKDPPQRHLKPIKWRRLIASATELSAAYHCSYRQVLRPAWIANVVSIQENIYMKRPLRYYIWKYGKKEPSFGTENQIQNSSKPCMVLDISQWPQELLAHSLVATPLNLLKHQNCHPEFRPIMTNNDQ